MYVVPETSSLLPQVGSSIERTWGGSICSQPFFWSSPMSIPQGINVYVGKHRSALVRAGGGLATLHSRLQQLTQVMSFTSSSVAAALSDGVSDGQLGPDTRRHLKSSLGTGVHPSPFP